MRLGTGGEVLSQILDDAVCVGAAFAGWVTETALALSVVEIENHVVVVFGGGTHGHCVEVKLVADLPRDHVVCAGGIAAKAETAQNLAIIRVEWQATREYNDSTDRLANHWIVGSAEARWV